MTSDVLRHIFYYCSDVTRAHVCSVSKQWHQDAVITSMSLSSIPKLYNGIENAVINKQLLKRVFKDYHLVVRLKLTMTHLESVHGVFGVPLIIHKADGEVLKLYKKIYPVIVGDYLSFYSESLFDDNFASLTLGHVHHYEEFFRQTCYTSNISHIIRMIDEKPDEVGISCLMDCGIRECARRGYIDALKYLLNRGYSNCNHMRGICNRCDLCFNARILHEFVSEYFDPGNNEMRTYSPKYDKAIEFLINEYLPSAYNDKDELHKIYCALSYKFCITGSLAGLKLVLKKIGVIDPMGCVWAIDALNYSCENNDNELSQFFIDNIPCDIVNCFSMNRDHPKVTFLAKVCYEKKLLQMNKILCHVVNVSKGMAIRMFITDMKLTTDDLNDAFKYAVRKNKIRSAKKLIQYGCTNYNRGMFNKGIIAVA